MKSIIQLNSRKLKEFAELIPENLKNLRNLRKIAIIAKNMTMIARFIEKDILNAVAAGKAAIIFGTRQVGKTTLLEKMFPNSTSVLRLNGDDDDVRSLFANMTSTRLKAIIGKADTVIVDEAQKIPDVGTRLKYITDQMKGIRLIATGSSSFELAGKVSESLTGRKRELKLSFAEMVSHSDLLSELRMIPQRMLYGYYPEAVTSQGNEKVILKELINSYLYKDILSLNSIAKSDKLVNLVKALAFQIGSQVSYGELAGLVGIDAKTVEKYIDILEKNYIVYRLPSYSKNMRNEIKFSRKIYFYDLGIRNAVIGNFAPMEMRNPAEVGHIWENFIITERMKKLSYDNSFAQCYFWRTQQNKEIDLIEEEDGELRAYEFKWNGKEKTKVPAKFLEAYPDAVFSVISPDNADEILL